MDRRADPHARRGIPEVHGRGLLPRRARAGRRGGRADRTRRTPGTAGRGDQALLADTVGAGRLPRLFMIEVEFALHAWEAELDWTRRTVEEIRDGCLSWPEAERTDQGWTWSAPAERSQRDDRGARSPAPAPPGSCSPRSSRLAGVRHDRVERHARRPDFCRSFNLNARSLDLLARRGLADGLVAEGQQVPHAPPPACPSRSASTARRPTTRTRWASRRPGSRRSSKPARSTSASTSCAATNCAPFSQDAEPSAPSVHDGRSDPGRVPRRLRRRPQHRPQAGRHRLPRHRRDAGSRCSATSSAEPDALPFGLTRTRRDGVRHPAARLRPDLIRERQPPADKDAPVTLELLQAPSTRCWAGTSSCASPAG